MSALATVAAAGELETRQERAQRRTEALGNAFQTVFETLAEIYRDEDWRYVNDANGRPYNGFTAFVCDQLGCASSFARRYQQGIVGLILPLQELVCPGARIPVTSADVARLGVAGARVVIEEAQAALEGVGGAEEQTAVLRELIESVSKRSSVPGFGPVVSSTVAESPLGALVPTVLPALPAAHAEEGQEGGGVAPVWPTAAESAHNSDGGAGVLAGSAPAGPPRQPAPTRPVSPAVAAGSAIDLGATARGSEEGSAGVGVGSAEATKELEAALEAILATEDPASLAERIPRSVGAHLAGECVAAAQRLARLGQLLRSLAA